MSPLNLTIVRGKSASFNIDVTVNAANGSCIPADLTGATVVFTAKESPFIPNIQFQKTANANGGIIIVNAANGNIQLNLLPTDTQPAYQTANAANGSGCWQGWGPPYSYPNYPGWNAASWSPQEGGTLCVDLTLTFPGGFVYTAAAGTLNYFENSPVNWANA